MLKWKRLVSIELEQNPFAIIHTSRGHEYTLFSFLDENHEYGNFHCGFSFQWRKYEDRMQGLLYSKLLVRARNMNISCYYANE